MKKKIPEENIKDNIRTPEENDKHINKCLENINVIFKKTYIGKLGNYYTNVIYTFSPEKYEIFKNDCEVL